MAFHVRHPVLLSSAPKAGAWAFATLFFMESVARATVSTVFPLQAYALFRDKGTVSLVYTGVACAALALSFVIPYLIGTLSRRWTYTLGCVATALCAALLTMEREWGQVAAMMLRTFGAATLNITLNLYIMDNIHKHELVRSEPLRYGVATLAWAAAPLLGVYLFQHVGIWAPALLSVVAASLLAALFWYLRLSEGGPIRAARSKPISPLHSVGRFIAQPRLRLAWAIAFARSSFWVTFFVYVPILMVEGGLDSVAGGIAIAAGNLMLLNNLVVADFARRHSIRRVLTAAFALSGVLVFATGFAGVAHPVVAGALMVVAAFFVAVMDGLGPIPFLRAVRTHERAQMTTVYRTYLDASELVPPFVYFFAFAALGFGGAFWALGAWLGVTGYLVWRYLPQRF